MVTRKKVSFYTQKPIKVPKKVKIDGKTFYAKGMKKDKMPKKDKTSFRIVSLVILAYLAGVINFNLGLIEMVVDMMIIVFVVDTLMNNPKKKKQIKKNKPKHCRFWKVCKLYNKEHKPCNEDEGFYGSNYAGCWKTMDEKERKNRKKRKRSKIKLSRSFKKNK